MPWCPECKAEYKEGMIECPDCKVALVDSLDELKKEDMQELLSFENSNLAEKFFEYLSYSEIPAECKTDEETQSVTVFVEKKNLKKAKKHFNAFYSVEANNILSRDMADMKEANETLPGKSEENPDWEHSVLFTQDNESEDDESKENMEQVLEDALDEVVSSSTPYEKKSVKANDLLSTTLVFLIFGILGTIFILLCAFNVITLFGGAIFYIVGGSLFLIFFIVAIQSYRSYKVTKEEAKQEEELTNSLNLWLEQAFTLETKNELLQQMEESSSDLSEELKYIRLNNEIKNKIVKQFGEIDDAYLDYIVEDFYNNHFN